MLRRTLYLSKPKNFQLIYICCVIRYKCAFVSQALKAAGKKKQWIAPTKLMSYGNMATVVEEALKERKGALSSSILGEVAQEVKVDLGFVQKIAKEMRPKKKSSRSSRH